MAPFSLAVARARLAELRSGSCGGSLFLEAHADLLPPAPPVQDGAAPSSGGAIQPPSGRPHGPLFYDPSIVLELGTTLLARHASSLPAIERFAITEQVFVAALDTGDTQLAKRMLDTITAAFPPAKSIRSQRLNGQYLETLGDHERAFDLYQAALDADEANGALWKRCIARFISMGDRERAIEALVGYVDRFMQDAEGWMMLAKLYADACRFQQAAFCLEEVLVLRPSSPLHQVRYAEVVASLGRLHTAVKYYSSALELLEDHVRALYGLRAVTAMLLKQYEAAESAGATGAMAVDKLAERSQDIEPIPKDTLVMLHELAGERLAAVYERQGKKGAELTSVVKTWLAAV
ncbi:hypothetical protein BC831DRAFT_443296 [Entophlyctis helioformis]|nr:hypothetical protein BC831DRAFT_443296 [Entophlyctis helioformis]